MLEAEEKDVVVVGSWTLSWSLDPGGGEAVASAVEVEGWAKTNEAREAGRGVVVVVSWRGKKMRKSSSLIHTRTHCVSRRYHLVSVEE